jgi:hypothetical protein
VISTTGLDFRFNPSDHSYWLGDTRLIGVSEAIGAAGLKSFDRINPEVLEHARQRGIAVHSACHFLDEGELDRATVTEEIEPFVRAWEKFKVDTGVVFTEIEKPLYHATHEIAGRPDRIIRLNGVRGVLDIKTYKADRVTGVQLAAYALLRFGPQTFDPPQRWAVWLKNDGKYSMDRFEDRGDEAVFMACLTIARFKGRKQ